MILLKPLHPNRWFLYFMLVAFIVLLVVYYAAQVYLIEEDARYLEQPISEQRATPLPMATVSVPTVERE
ncbi:MAG: hypothetical protein AAB367_04270 [Patescibacteria group bacterium]